MVIKTQAIIEVVKDPDDPAKYLVKRSPKGPEIQLSGLFVASKDSDCAGGATNATIAS